MSRPFIRRRSEDWRRPRGGTGDLWSGGGANFRTWLHGKPRQRRLDPILVCSGFACAALGFIYRDDIMRMISLAIFRLQDQGW